MADKIAAGMLLKLAAIKAKTQALNEEHETIAKALVERMVANGQKTISTGIDGEEIKGTLVQAQRVKYDEDRLKGALTAKQWGKVTTAVLDKTKLEAAIVIGEVDPNTVAACSTVTDTKPYVKISGQYVNSTRT